MKRAVVSGMLPLLLASAVWGQVPEAMPEIAADAAPIIATATLPRDLSLWGMYRNADVVIQTVLLGLLAASVATWTVWLAKTIELLAAKRRLRRTLLVLARIDSSVESAARNSEPGSEIARFVQAAETELRVSAGVVDKDGIKERIASRLQRIEAEYGRRIMRGTGILATIGATAPFVGLFGTVWGIMNSFIGISKSQTTNLAVVAPGIAEALLATALGLAAAIPAVVIYNMFARSIAGYRAKLGDASAEVMRLVGRQLDSPNASPVIVVARAAPLSAAK